jgi:hypothetical protein
MYRWTFLKRVGEDAGRLRTGSTMLRGRDALFHQEADRTQGLWRGFYGRALACPQRARRHFIPSREKTVAYRGAMAPRRVYDDEPVGRGIPLARE